MLFHNHSHHGDDHHGHDHPSHSEDGRPVRASTTGRRWLRFAVAGAILLGGAMAACAVMVQAGQAVVVTRFGAPVAVLREPGLGWKLPLPIDATAAVDLRLRTSSTGLQDVGTRDGLRVQVQAYVAWQVPPAEMDILRYLRSVRNDPDEAARQLRSLVAAALQVTASSFDLAELVNTDPDHVRLADFESRVQAQIADRTRQTYGIAIRQVGIERLGLPDGTLLATVGRMRAERETVATQVTTEGARAAAAIRSEAERDSRIALAGARSEAAAIDAQSQTEAAAIRARAFDADPQLYEMIRSLDTIAAVVGGNTRLILRTDAAPFRALVEGPPQDPAK